MSWYHERMNAPPVTQKCNYAIRLELAGDKMSEQFVEQLRELEQLATLEAELVEARATVSNQYDALDILKDGNEALRQQVKRLTSRPWNPVRVEGYVEDRAEMLQEMIEDGHLFLFETDGRIEFSVNCNDVFDWGCADAQPLPLDEVENAYRTDPLHWAILKRGVRPQKPYEESMRQNGHWHSRLDGLPAREASDE